MHAGKFADAEHPDSLRRRPADSYCVVEFVSHDAHFPLAEVRANLSKLELDEAVRTHQRIEVTRKGRRAAVILSADDYDSIMETLAIA